MRHLLSYFRAHRWLRAGFLPRAGGWLEQDARTVAALEVIMHEEGANPDGRR